MPKLEKIGASVLASPDEVKDFKDYMTFKTKYIFNAYAESVNVHIK